VRMRGAAGDEVDGRRASVPQTVIVGDVVENVDHCAIVLQRARYEGQGPLRRVH